MKEGHLGGGNSRRDGPFRRAEERGLRRRSGAENAEPVLGTCRAEWGLGAKPEVGRHLRLRG